MNRGGKEPVPMLEYQYSSMTSSDSLFLKKMCTLALEVKKLGEDNKGLTNVQFN